MNGVVLRTSGTGLRLRALSMVLHGNVDMVLDHQSSSSTSSSSSSVEWNGRGQQGGSWRRWVSGSGARRYGLEELIPGSAGGAESGDGARSEGQTVKTSSSDAKGTLWWYLVVVVYSICLM